MKSIVFVQIPTNYPSGGIKVANQLVNLFRENNYESYVVLPSEIYEAKWMLKPAPAINIARMKEICKEEDILIDNWIDRETFNIVKNLKCRVKIFYSQGCTFYKSKDLIGDEHLRNDMAYTHYWTVSSSSLEYLTKKYPRIKQWHKVSPYFEFEAANKAVQKIERKNSILCISRKGKSYISISNAMFKKSIKFDIVGSYTEEECYKLMASHKYFLSTAVGVNKQNLKNIARYVRYGNNGHNMKIISPGGYMEGFPLPPAEAAMCGAIVIGFAMGGGLEWMSPSNCYLAKDRSYISLINRIKEALSTSDEKISIIRENAFDCISYFNKNNTWQQVRSFLKNIE